MSLMPYSYHTFMYPFYWKDQDKDNENSEKKVALQEYINTKRWKAEDICITGDGKTDKLFSDPLIYATYQYFMPKARKMVFDTKENSISCYKLNEPCILKFCFDSEKDGEEDWYILSVNDIRLEFLEDLNIGVLIFEAKNYGLKMLVESNEEKRLETDKSIYKHFFKKEDDDSYRFHDCLDGLSQKKRLLEITRINDLGRRVFSPYLKISEKDGTFSCSKGDEAPLEVSLIIEGKEEPEQLVDCRSIDERFHKRSLKLVQSPDYFENLILDKKKEKLELYPAIDDRMYVVCCMGANKLSALQHDSNGYVYSKARDSYSLMNMQLLYQIIFLERDGNLSCQNREMLLDKLKSHLYARWIDYGTVYGVTEYSLVCITGCDDSGRLSDDLKAAVIDPFLTEYTEMAKIALLQRAEIIKLEDEVSDVSEHIKPFRENNADEEENFEDAETMKKNIARIQNTWRKYIMFQNELLLPEVTFQEQGVEIYDMLKNSFRIEKLSGYLDSDLNNLHDMADFEDNAIKRKRDEEDAENDRRLSNSVNLFSIVGLSLAIASAIQDALGYAGITTGSGVKSIRQGLWKLLVFAIEFILLYFLNKDLLKDVEPGKKSDYKLVNWSLWIGTGLIIVIGMLMSMI